MLSPVDQTSYRPGIDSLTMERTNGITEAIERKTVAVGAEAKTHSLAAIELYDELNLDFVWLDLEHAGPSPLDSKSLEEFARAAASIEPLVRIPKGEPYIIRKVLDTGLRTLLIPRIEEASEVRRAVRAAYFDHDGSIGDRGVGSARGGGWGEDMEDHIQREDRSVLIGAMIENRSAVENIEDILSVPGLGFVFMGPADLSVSLGRPLETTAPPVQEAIETVETAAQSAGVPIGRITNEPAAIETAVETGYDILRIGSELGAASAVLTERRSVL